MQTRKVALILFEGFAMWQVALLLKLLKKASYEVDVFSMNRNDVMTDGGITIKADHNIEEADSANYDLVLFPGASIDIPESDVKNEHLRHFLQKSNGLIAASCASSVFLGAAGLLRDRSFTTMEGTKEQYSFYFQDAIYSGEDICVDGSIITSKGFAHYEFMNEILATLGLFEEDARLERMAKKLGRNE